MDSMTLGKETINLRLLRRSEKGRPLVRIVPVAETSHFTHVSSSSLREGRRAFNESIENRVYTWLPAPMKEPPDYIEELISGTSGFQP